MGTFGQKLDNAAAGALCVGLDAAGSTLIGAGAVSLAFGGAGAVPIALGAAALMASQAGCTWDPNKDAGPPEGPPIDICTKPVGETRITTTRYGNPNDSTPWMVEITGITYLRRDPCSDGIGATVYQVTGVTKSGAQYDGNIRSGACGPGPEIWSQEYREGDACEVPITPADPLPVIEPYVYTDPDDGCQLTVNWKGLATDGNGHVSPVFKIEPTPELRASGGIIGGCNFSPIIYTAPPNGPPRPPITAPWDPNWDLPNAGPNPWADFLRDLAAGIAGEVVYDILQSFFQTTYPGLIYRMVSVCEKDASGEPISEAVEVPILPLTAPDAQIARLDAIVELLQASKNFKQPICEPEKPCLEGEWRTISFRSASTSPYGKSRLRKRFRYRSMSGFGLGSLVDHWKDFTFQSGPVIVAHKGHTWGTPQVWAASINEGKRVIQHAAREAGFDAFETGEWVISSSSSPRYGVSDTMSVDTTGGYYWITDRDGSDGRPIVAEVPNP